MEALQAILTRRSTRQYSEEMPPRELIERVVEAGRFAPSGSNSQSTHFIVITDPAVLLSLADAVRSAFAGMELSDDP